jgi:hypothetical protein
MERDIENSYLDSGAVDEDPMHTLRCKPCGRRPMAGVSQHSTKTRANSAQCLAGAKSAEQHSGGKYSG